MPLFCGGHKKDKINMNRKISQQGFTLVELLIVMTIISIMAVGVLVGIKPIEQDVQL